MAKAKKVREPKADNTNDTKKKVIKKDTKDKIQTVLNAYSAARATVQVLTQSAARAEDGISGPGAAAFLKSIRNAQEQIRHGRDIVSSMRNTLWREAMLEHLVLWETDLMDAWNQIIEALDKEE